MPSKITVPPENAGERLDKFLTARLREYSRSQIQKMIKNGAVSVNGGKTSVHRFLKEKDVIEFKTPPPGQSAEPEEEQKPDIIHIF